MTHTGSPGYRPRPQGQTVDVRARQCVVPFKAYCDQERRPGPTGSTQDAVGRVAQALGLGKRTVQEILHTYRQTGPVAPATLDATGKPPYRIQQALETVRRQRIGALNRQGSPISVRSRVHWLSEPDAEVPRATLGRALQRMGFVYGQARQPAALREGAEVGMARRASLRAKRANRQAHGGTVRPAGSLDERSVTMPHATPRTWYFAEEGPWVHTPSGTGPRFIIVHAMTPAGWVPGAQWVFQAKRRPGDDHGPMDGAHFRRGCCTSFLPHIPAACRMVMENAPYQNVYVDEVFYPTTATQKAARQRWLQQHHPTMDQEARIQAALRAVCRQLCPQPAYAWDRLAEAAGHQI